MNSSQNTPGALQRLDPMPPVERSQPQDLLELAVKQGASVDTLERLMVVRKEIMAERARSEFFEALAAFQSEIPIIVRTRAGHENRYNYAPLEHIIKVVTPYLNKHGFSHQADGVVTDGWVEAIVTVIHRGGHKEEKRFKVPSESKSGMSPQQKFGAAMTYATRYAFCAAFGIRTADQDTDCPPDGTESVTELVSKLWNLCKPVSNGDRTWKTSRQWLTDECQMDPGKRVNDLSAEELIGLINRAKARMKELNIV